MRKMLTLLFILLLTLGLLAGYLFLTKEITAGSLKIAAGQVQLAQGELTLAKGKAKLSSGEQRLSQSKSEYSTIKTASFVWMVTLPVAGAVAALTGNNIVNNKIAEGDQLVAKGKSKVKAGEEQVNAGKLELQRGKERLKQANKIRAACASGTVFFATLFVALVFCWRRSLIGLFKR